MDAVILPGAILPAALAYADLLSAFDAGVDARSKELEVYAGTEVPPPHYGMETEIDGIDRLADEAGFARFHLVGYSAGGASALAYALAHPDRLRSLTLSEPAWAGTDGRLPAEVEAADRVLATLRLPPGDMVAAFMRAQIEDGVEPPAPPQGPPPAWMGSRPAGAVAIAAAFERHAFPPERMRTFAHPVLFALGGRSRHAYYGLMAERLRGVFPDFSLAVFPDRHHFDPPHRTEPERYAGLLEEHWRRAEENQG